MTGLSCCICSSPLGDSIYESAGEMSITSLARTYPGKTQVYFCGACEHVQTSELPDIDDYYDKAYNILAESEEEDHIYEYDGDKPVYRNDHQLNLLTAKTRLPEGGKVIDYGCGKGATLRGLLERRPDIDGHLFDVSDNYLNYWKSLVDEGKWATYSTPEAWDGTFDTVVSMFALEHVARPADMLSTVRKLLKQDGQFFFIVPNFLTNISDMIVVDHVNHFTMKSLITSMEDCGLVPVEIDGDSYRGAWVVVAKRDDADAVSQEDQTSDSVAKEVAEIAGFWRGAAAKLTSFEQDNEGKPSAIFGSGFYGSYILSTLDQPERIRCFVDNNPYLQGTTHFEKPVMAPKDLPEDIGTVYVGLNPQIASDVIAGVEPFQARDLRYFVF